MWRNWNLCAMLVGMQNHAAIVENSLEVTQKLKIELPCDPTSGCISKRIQNQVLGRDLYIHV